MNKSSDTGMIRASSLGLWARAVHDLRQPIQSALLLTEVMANTQDAAKRQQMARTMEDALVGLQAMLDDLGRIARLDAKLDGPNLMSCSLPEVAADVARGLASVATERNVSLRIEVQPATVTSDVGLLEKVLAGLVLNALKFGTGNQIRVGCRHHSNEHHIEIDFTGPAITAVQQEQAFIELRSPNGAVPVDRPVAGLGLVRQMASVIGGVITCTSLSEHGQRLSLVLPPHNSVAKRTG